jgi:hypothetical protein
MTAEPSVSGQSPEERIRQEHSNLKALLERVEATTDLSGLRDLVVDLRGMLGRHFVTEEEPDGFYESVAASAPHLAVRIERLLAEHAAFLADLDELVGRIESCLAGPVAELRRDAAALSKRIREHEQRETDLLSDSVYNDLGGGD